MATKCAVDIKKDIVDKATEILVKGGAEVQGDVGFFPNPSNSTKVINGVNKEFNSLVVKESEKGSFTIDPSDRLVDAYFEAYKIENPTEFNNEPINKVKYKFKSFDISDNNIAKIRILFNKLKDTDIFWKKIQQDFQIPKDQLELIRQQEGSNFDEKLVSFLASYSYTIEINTATTNKKLGDDLYKLDNNSSIGRDPNGGLYILEKGPNPLEDTHTYISEKEVIDIMGETGYKQFLFNQTKNNTDYYSDLTVPGGTNYTENEIATPAITPSIKGHAQFATDQGIGWFRSDDKVVANEIIQEFVIVNIEGTDIEAGPFTDRVEVERYALQNNIDFSRITISATSGGKISGSIRRILEVQSDWAQKIRKSSEPDINVKYDIQQIINDLQKSGDLKIDCN